MCFTQGIRLVFLKKKNLDWEELTEMKITSYPDYCPMAILSKKSFEQNEQIY